MSKRSAQGAGTIRKKVVARQGKTYTYWEARVTVGRDPGTGKQIQKSFSGKTQREVREKMQAAAVAVTEGTYIEPSRMTLSQWLDIWEKDYLGGVKPHTVRAYSSIIRIHLKPSLGAAKLEALHAHTIQEFYNGLGAGREGKPGLSPKTVKNIHGVLHEALQQAIRLGYLRSNPADACELPRVEKKEIRPLDSDEISRFLAAIKGHRFEAVYIVDLFTGLRRGEILGLTWARVDLARGSIRIDRQLQSIPGQRGAYRLAATKSDKARTIAPASLVIATLRRWKARQAEWQLRAGPDWEGEGYVFTDELGHHLSPSTVYHNYKRLVASIGLPEARFHDLRHSYAVASLRAGDDIKTVQDNLGHATASFTLDVYGHVTDEMKRASAARMDSFIESLGNL